MIVKFFSRGSGGGKGVADYLMGKDRQREGASVLRGDIEQTKEIIDGLNFSRNYTAGVLSFEENHADLTKEKKEEIMNRFEEAIFSGLEPNQRDITWIEHTDKNERLELNFVIPNVELQTGKRLQPYYHQADKHRINNCKDLINYDFNLSDPNSPEKRRMLTTAKDLPENKKEALEAINQAVLARIQTKEINDRKDVVNFLESAGFELARTTKQSISIKNPDGGQNLRLKGAFYEESFEASRELTADYGELAERHRQEVARNIQRTREVYRGQLKQTAERNRELYSQATSGREKISGQLQERTREEYNADDLRDSAYTTVKSATNPKEMDEYDSIHDGSFGRVSSATTDTHIHEQLEVQRNERLEAISRDLQKGIEQDRNRTMYDGGRESIDPIMRENRPEIQESALGRESGFNDYQREIGVKNDRSRKTIVTHIRELRSSIYERISAFTERFRNQRETDRAASKSLSGFQDENRRTFERIESNISESGRNVTESNRLATSVGENNKTLENMRVREQEKHADRGMSLGM